MDTERGYDSQALCNFMSPSTDLLDKNQRCHFTKDQFNCISGGGVIQEQKIPSTYDNTYSSNTQKLVMVEEPNFKLPLHLIQKNSHQMSLFQNSTVNTNRSDKAKLIFCGNYSNRTGEHQSSYNTADFTREEKQEREDLSRRNEGDLHKCYDNNLQNESSQTKISKKSMEIINYYNRSVNSEMSQENMKENKMLKDALYATIKLVLDQNKQIKKLKEVVTHRNLDKSNKTSNVSNISRNDESLLPDLSLLSISKDGVNPVEAVNNFIREHMPTTKNLNKGNFTSLKSQVNNCSNVNQESTSKCLSKNAESINEAMLKELGKKILRDTSIKKNRDKSEGEQKDNERYGDNSCNSNGNSFYTNKNLLNTSMSPIHKVDTKTNNKEQTSEHNAKEKLKVDNNVKKSLKNFQNLDRDELDEMLPEHLTLMNDELLGHLYQANDDNQSPIIGKIPRVIEDNSESKDINKFDFSNERSLSSSKRENDDSAINHCNDYSQNIIDKTDIHTLIYDTSTISKNNSDFWNKSGIKKEKYDGYNRPNVYKDDSYDENAYDDNSQEGLFGYN